MSENTSGPHLGTDAAERLIEAAAHGNATPTDPLAALLTAATAPDHDRALAGEEAALAQFRAAQQPTPNRGHHRAIRTTATAILIALSLSGIAVAADTARPQAPLPHQLTPTPSSPSPHNSPNPDTEPRPSQNRGLSPKPVDTGNNITSLLPLGRSASSFPQQASTRFRTAPPAAGKPRARANKRVWGTRTEHCQPLAAPAGRTPQR